MSLKNFDFQITLSIKFNKLCIIASFARKCILKKSVRLSKNLRLPKLKGIINQESRKYEPKTQ